MRIALAQINPTLADFSANSKKIIEYTQKAADRRANLVVFPECALFGYHPFDLLERSDLIDEQLKYVSEIQKKIPAGISILFGLITRNKAKKGRPYYNSAALLTKGKPVKYFHKSLLPTGDVFDEARFIEPGKMEKNFFTLGGKKFFVTICEDIWAWPDEEGISPYAKNPITDIKYRPDLVINLSASPFFCGKMELRKRMTTKTAKHFKAPMMYVNLVGAQDEVIYDGGSFVVTPNGKTLFHSQFFQEDLNVFDIKTNESWHDAQVPTNTELLRQALVLGIRDFCEKTGLQKIHLGLSGGIDSAVAVCLAVDAVGPAKVAGIALPGPFSASQSYSLAEELAKNLKIKFMSLEIKDSYKTVLAELEKGFNVEGFSVLNENLQARLRGIILMAYANKENSLLFNTGNKSEMATGYSTLYGDMCGGLAPLGDLTKHQIYELAEYYNATAEIIPKGIITRPPTAELRANQKDQDSLPPYDKLDSAVEHLIEKAKPVRNKTDQWVLEKISVTEFKRWQAPPILKVSPHSFGRGRRWPIAHKAYRNKLKET
ncbi:MAG: NAD+ synthase [Bdellovibrionota bacterium]